MSHPIMVGITGHRPNRLAPFRVDALNVQLDDAIQALICPPTPAALISCLAEGADRMAAWAALRAGWGLQCILPFQPEEYRCDFPDPASKAEFDALLRRAGEVMAIPGDRADEPAAYMAAGEAMLERVDPLIAIWDGGDSAGRGGTREIITEASKRGLPVLWLHATADRPPTLLNPACGRPLSAGWQKMFTER